MDKSMIPILVAMVAIVAAGAALALHGGGAGETPSGQPPQMTADNLYFVDTDIEMKINENKMLEVTVIPDKLSDQVVWTSIAEICSIKQTLDSCCIIEAVGAGECYVTASAGGKTATCHVTIIKETTPVPVEPDGPLVLSPAVITLTPGDAGATMASKKAEWSASDATVCSVTVSSDGRSCVVVALKAGECTLTATSGEESASCRVNVLGSGLPADIPGAAIPGASPAMEVNLELAPGGSKAIGVPSEYLSLLSMVQWSSSDPSVCTVMADPVAGTVIAVAHKAGECDLTASLGFYSAVCHVTVGRS